MHRLDVGRGVRRLAARISTDRLVEPVHDLAAAERFLDEIERAVLDRAHRHRNIALARDHEDRRRIILAVKFLEDVESGLSGDMHIEQDARRRSGTRDREQRCAVGKTDHFIAARRQHHRQCIANGGIVVDHEYLATGTSIFRHAPSSCRRLRLTRSRPSVAHRPRIERPVFVREADLTHK
ncbi:hypothetical protein ES707_00578 [subsurface metagenome]